jgi:hypothetical protein
MDVFSMEQGIQIGFVKTSEFQVGGEGGFEPPLSMPLISRGVSLSAFASGCLKVQLLVMLIRVKKRIDKLLMFAGR